MYILDILKHINLVIQYITATPVNFQMEMDSTSILL